MYLIVNITFEGEIPSHLKKARLDINLDLNETHNQRIVNSGGVAMAYKDEELIAIKTMYDELKEKIQNRSARIGVIGLGYVGLDLAIEFAGCGFRVMGIDVDEERVELLNDGKNYIIKSNFC